MAKILSWGGGNVQLPQMTVGTEIERQTIYRYEGAPFDNVSDYAIVPGQFEIGQRILGWVSVPSLLGAGIKIWSPESEIAASVTSWQFHNGRGTNSSAEGSTLSLNVTTDASGKIIEWRASGYDSHWQNTIGHVAYQFSAIYESDFAGEGPWGQDQANAAVMVSSSQGYGELGVASNTPGAWLDPVTLVSGTVNGERLTGTGIADVIVGFAGADRILGSLGDDELFGGSGSDTLVGGAGNDRLAGGTDDDQLLGGRGADFMTGNVGNDSFVFLAKADCGDKVNDFHNINGDNDAFSFNVNVFGAGLAAGALADFAFIIAPTNLAGDANDRFIFRYTDTTLWFDRNGNADGGLILVADLQAGAVMTASDIFLI